MGGVSGGGGRAGRRGREKGRPLPLETTPGDRESRSTVVDNSTQDLGDELSGREDYKHPSVQSSGNAAS